MKGKIIILLASGIFIVLGLASYFFVTSRHFHHYILTRIIQEAEEATGGKVEIKDFSFHLSRLGFDLDHFVLRGTESGGERPLFEADNIFVAVDLSSVLHRKVRLTRLVLDRPVMHLIVGEEGPSNIPSPAAKRPSGAPPSRFDLFSLAIHHFQINQGQLHLNDRQIRLDAELRDVAAMAHFEPANKQYAGSFSYRQGTVKYHNWNTVHHRLSLQFVATSSDLTINNLALSTGSSRLSLHGNLQNYTNPTFKGDYEILLAMQDLGQMLKNASIPAGMVRTNGSLTYVHAAGRSWLQGLTVQGDFQSAELVEETQDFRRRLRSVRGHYQLAAGDLEASDLRAELLGGHASASLRIHDLPGTPHFRIQGSFRGLSLAALKTAARNNSLGTVPFSGRADGRFNLDWRGRLSNLHLQSDLDITASALANAREVGIPVRGEIHLDYRADRDALALRHTYFQTPHSEVRLNGALGQHAKLRVAAHTRDLHELDLLLQEVLRSPSPAPTDSSSAGTLGLKGAASFRGAVEGTLKSPTLAGTLTARDFQVRATRWRSLHAAVNLDASAAVLQSGHLRGPDGRGRVRLEGRLQLSNWAYQRQNPFAMRVAISQLPVDTAQQLAGWHYPVKGLISARASVQGTPDRPVADGQINLQKLEAWQQPVENVEVDFRADGESLQSNLKLRAEPGVIRGDFVYHLRDRKYNLQAHTEGIQLGKLAVVRARDLALRGELNFSLTGSGPWSSPRFQLAAQVPQLQFRQESFRNVILRAEVVHRQAHLKLTTADANASVDAAATLDMNGDYPLDFSLRAGRLSLAPLLASYLPHLPPELSGTAELHGWLRGPLRQPKLLQGQVEVSTLRLIYRSLQLRNQNPLHLAYANGVFSLEAAEFIDNDSRLQVRGTIPLSGSSPLNLTLRGDVNLKELQMLNTKVETSGQLKLDVTARGSWSQPRVEGGLKLVNASVHTDQIPTGLERVNARLAIQGDRLVIEEFSASSGGGQVTASGFLLYRPQLTFNVTVQGNSVRLRYPPGIRSLLEGNLALAGTLAEPRLTGRVLIDRLSFTNEFDLDTFVSQFAGPSPAAPPRGFLSRLRLNLQVESTEELSLASSRLSLQGSANLRVGGTATNPVFVGRTVMKGGEIFFLGQRYEIQRGVVDFTNPNRTEPVVNVLITATVDHYDLSINLAGSLDRLRTHYTSDPPLPAADIINLLAFGKTTEASAAGSRVPTTLGSESLLAKGITSQLSSRVEKLAGISHLQIDPLLGGNQRDPGARLALQQRIAGNLLLTYATDVRSTQNQLIQVQYRATPRLSISVTRGENGGIAADFRFHKSF